MDKKAQLLELVEFHKSNCPLKTSGIYCMYNKMTDKVYFGKSKDIRARLFYHRTKLEGGDHPNKELQIDYNKYYKSNPGCFIGCLIQAVPMNQIDKAERTYIEHFESYKPEIGYNTQIPKKNQD